MAIDCMLDFQQNRMAKIKMTARLRSHDELLAEGTFEGNPCPSSGYLKSSIEVESTSANSSSKGETSSSGGMRKKRGRAQEKPIQEVVAEGSVFPGSPQARTSRMGGALTSQT